MRLNGKVERSHRIDNEEFYRLLDGVVIDDTKMFNDKLDDKLDEWQNFYNFDRPHGGLAGQAKCSGFSLTHKLGDSKPSRGGSQA